MSDGDPGGAATSTWRSTGPAPNNDLTDLARALPALAQAARRRPRPATVTALKESVPITAFFGPYAPDLVGTLRTFGQAAAYYDANGHYARVSPVFPDFTLGSNNTLAPGDRRSRRSKALKTGQLRRCPGAATQPAADGSSPFVDGELLSCDPLADALMDRRRRNSLAASPLLIGAVTTLIVRRRRVPVLQRQQRAAVRADLQHQGRTARGLRAAALQPGAHRAARASASSARCSTHQNPRTGQGQRDRRPEARKESRTAARRHEGDRAVGLGDRPEVPRTRKGHLEPDAQGRRDDPRQPDDANR